MWQISGMVPRVLLQASASEELGERSAGAAGSSSELITGPSGHVYCAGLPATLSEIVEETLGASDRSETQPLRLLRAGCDTDTSEVVLRRALDVLQSAAAADTRQLDAEALRLLLEHRSAEWATW